MYIHAQKNLLILVITADSAYQIVNKKQNGFKIFFRWKLIWINRFAWKQNDNSSSIYKHIQRILKKALILCIYGI